MIKNLKKNIIRQIFNYINFIDMLKIIKKNKRLKDINNIDIKTFELVKFIIDYYKNHKISFFFISQDNDLLFKELEKYIHLQEKNKITNENINESKNMFNILNNINNLNNLNINNNQSNIPIPPPLNNNLTFTTNSDNKINNEEKNIIKKLDINQLISDFFNKPLYIIRNIILLTQLSLLKPDNYSILFNHLLFSTKNSIPITTILIPSNFPSYIFLGNNKGELIIINLYNKYNSNKYIYPLHKSVITKIIEVKSINEDKENKIIIASCSRDKTIKLLTFKILNKKSEIITEKNLNLLTTLKEDKPIHTIVEINNYSLASGTNEILIWNLLDYGKYYALDKHYGTVFSLYYNDTDYLYVGSAKLKIMSTKRNKLKGIVYNNEKIPTFENKGSFAIKDIIKINSKIIVLEDNNLIIYNLESKDNKKKSIIQFDYFLNKLKNLNIDDLLLIAGKNNNLILFDFEKKIIKSIIKLSPTDNIINDISIDENNNNLYYCSNKGNFVYIENFFNYLRLVEKKNIFWENYGYYVDELDDNDIKINDRTIIINIDIKLKTDEFENITDEENIVNNF